MCAVAARAGSASTSSLPKPERALSERERLELIRTFADQAVIAIENVRLFKEVQARTADLQESLQQQTATADVLQVISASPGELEPVFDMMLASAMRLCEASHGAIWLREGDSFRSAALGGAWHGDFVERFDAELSREPVRTHRWRARWQPARR